MRPRILIRSAVYLGLFASLVSACKNSTDSSDPAQVPIHGISIVLGASTKAAAAFAPNPFSVSLAAGGTAVWANVDYQSGGYGSITGTTHHLVSDTPLFNSGLISPRKSFSFTFTATGTYTYHCSIHPAMVGTIDVGS